MKCKEAQEGKPHCGEEACTGILYSSLNLNMRRSPAPPSRIRQDGADLTNQLLVPPPASCLPSLSFSFLILKTGLVISRGCEDSMRLPFANFPEQSPGVE